MQRGRNRHSIRLPHYDYSSSGAYFVTICAQEHQCLLGNILGEEMVLNDPGVMIERWYKF